MESLLSISSFERLAETFPPFGGKDRLSPQNRPSPSPAAYGRVGSEVRIPARLTKKLIENNYNVVSL